MPANTWPELLEAPFKEEAKKIAADAKAKVESMHSAADPIEGDRIHQERIAKIERAKALAAAQAAANSTITSCDSTGCWTGSGQRLQRIPGTNRVVGPNGSCSVIGTQLQC